MITRPGKTLTEEQLLNLGADLCSRADYSRAEVTRRLVRKGATAQEAKGVVERLAQLGYIDDSRFARGFVHDKVYNQHWGRIKVSAHLAKAGVERDIAREAMEQEVDDESYMEVIADVARAKSSLMGGVAGREQKQKLLRYLASRGFELALAVKALRQIANPDE